MLLRAVLLRRNVSLCAVYLGRRHTNYHVSFNADTYSPIHPVPLHTQSYARHDHVSSCAATYSLTFHPDYTTQSRFVLCSMPRMHAITFPSEPLRSPSRSILCCCYHAQSLSLVMCCSCTCLYPVLLRPQTRLTPCCYERLPTRLSARFVLSCYARNHVSHAVTHDASAYVRFLLRCMIRTSRLSHNLLLISTHEPSTLCCYARPNHVSFSAATNARTHVSV